MLQIVLLGVMIVRYAPINNVHYVLQCVLLENLQTLKLPAQLTEIAPVLFRGCKKLNQVIIPEGVTVIGDHAFYDCSNLTHLLIPTSVTSIGNKAFNDCSNLNVEIPATVTNLGGGVFFGCKSFKIAAGNPVLKIDEHGALLDTAAGKLLYLPDDFAGKYEIPEGINEIADYALAFCKKLQSVKIPASVTRIGNMAFYEVQNLQSIKFPEGLCYIGESAFSWCRKLNSVTVPENCEISENAFYYGCKVNRN